MGREFINQDDPLRINRAPAYDIMADGGIPGTEIFQGRLTRGESGEQYTKPLRLTTNTPI